MLCPSLGDDLYIVGPKHLAIHATDQLSLVPTPAEYSTLGTLEGYIIRIQKCLDEGG